MEDRRGYDSCESSHPAILDLRQLHRLDLDIIKMHDGERRGYGRYPVYMRLQVCCLVLFRERKEK